VPAGLLAWGAASLCSASRVESVVLDDELLDSGAVGTADGGGGAADQAEDLAGGERDVHGRVGAGAQPGAPVGERYDPADGDSVPARAQEGGQVVGGLVKLLAGRAAAVIREGLGRADPVAVRSYLVISQRSPAQVMTPLRFLTSMASTPTGPRSR
jgi:hypothetical protein